MCTVTAAHGIKGWSRDGPLTHPLRSTSAYSVLTWVHDTAPGRPPSQLCPMKLVPGRPSQKPGA